MRGQELFSQSLLRSSVSFRRVFLTVNTTIACILMVSFVVAGRQSAPTTGNAQSPRAVRPPTTGPGAPGTAATRPSQNFSGTINTRDGAHLRFVTDLGSITIHTHDAATVDYRAHVETDSSAPNARALLRNFQFAGREMLNGVLLRGVAFGHPSAGRLWVTLDVTVPKDYALDVVTGGGNITTDDVNGRANLQTQGGNITTGNINGTARLVAVAGGHITVKNVASEFVAETGGGHITTGHIGGNATMRTSGGHIRSESIDGAASLETGGGNITLEHAGAALFAQTNGGQIQVGEAAGLVQAKTDGGGIRVVRASGAATLESADGSIYLTQVDGSVKASTETGGITAWFVSPAKNTSESELESSNGDIVVYISRALPVTIDAQVEMGQSHGFVVDPSFPIKVYYDNGPGGERVARAEGALNGGGEVLHLRTIAGNIRLLSTNMNEQMHLYRQQMEGLEKQVEQLQRIFQPLQQITNDPRQP